MNVAGVYPWNPFVQAQYLPNGRPFIPGAPGNAIGQSSYYVWAMQRFELAHQRRHREDSAMAALGQIRWNIQQAELLNIAQTERLFFTALYQRQLLELAADPKLSVIGWPRSSSVAFGPDSGPTCRRSTLKLPSASPDANENSPTRPIKPRCLRFGNNWEC